jgi:hypothetical protein
MRGLGAKVVMVAFGVGLLSNGCSTTLSEIRTKEPCRSISSTKAPQGLAKCIEFKMQAELGGGLIVNLEDYRNSTYRVALQQGMDRGSAVADVLVKPADSGSVVEVRKWDLSSITSMSKILDMIERCAQ